MSSNYRGDSPSKKFARLAFWEQIKQQLGPKRFQQGRFLTLASREAGDVAVLLGLGANEKNIVAVDVVQREAEEAKKKFPGVDIRHAEARDYLRSSRREFDAIFLDFCTSLNPILMTTVRTAVRHLEPEHGILGISFMLGRERDVLLDSIQEERAWLGTSDEKALIARARVIDSQINREDNDPRLYARWLARYFGSGNSNAAHNGHRAPMGIYMGSKQMCPDEEIPVSVFEQKSDDVSYAVLHTMGDKATHLLNLSVTSIGAVRANAARKGMKWKRSFDVLV